MVLSFGQLKPSRFIRSPGIVKVLVAQQFFEGFVPIMALYAIMFERVGGLQFQQIGMLFAAWSLAYVAVELPSGVLADYWSRKKVIALGGLLRGAGFLIWLAWPSFGGFLVGFMLWGCAIGCTSGAVAAYLHNELRTGRKDAQFAKYYGWVMAALYAGMLAGYSLAAVLTLRQTVWLIGLSAASSFMWMVMIWRAPESPYKKQDTYLKTLRAGIRAMAVSRTLQYVSFALFSVFMVIGVLEELLPRIYAVFGAGDSIVALVLAGSLLFTVFMLTRLESFVRFSLAKQMLFMAVGLVVLLLGLWIGGLPAIALVLVFDLIFQLFRPVFMHHIQATADTDERATISSIPGLAAGFLGACAYWAMGKIAAYTSETYAIGAYVVLWLVVFLLLAIVGRRISIRPGRTDTGSPLEVRPGV